MKNLVGLLKPPLFKDEKSNQQAGILHVILWSLLILALIYLAFSLVFSPQTAAEDVPISGVGILLNSFLLALLRRGHLRLASILQVACFWSMFTVIAFSLNGIFGPAYMMGYILVILIAGILLEGRGALVMTVLSLLAGLVMAYFQKNELLPFNSIPTVESYWIVSAFMFPMCAILQYLAAQTLRRAVTRASESEAAYRILFDESPLAAIVTDLTGVCVDVNPIFCKLLGMPRSDMLGKSMFELGVLTDEERQKIVEAAMEQGGTLDQHETVLRLKNGKISHVIVSTKPILLHSTPHILNVINDITRRVETERELRESEKRFRSLSDAALEGVMVHKEGAILDANRKFAEIFGYESPEELIGKNGFQFLLTPESRKIVLRRSRHHSGAVFEVEGVRKDGSVFPGETQSRAINFRGESARVVSMRDISQRKVAEAELRRLNRALRTISKCNEALVRAGNQEELLREICKTIVEVGEYQVAGINLVESEGEDVYRPVYSFVYPDEESHPGNQAIFSDCWEQFSGSLHATMNDWHPVFINRRSETNEAPALRRLPGAYPALGILPLQHEDTILGVLMIFSSREDAFDQEETLLISEMAADLSYGLHSQRMRQERKTFLEKLEVTNRELEFSYDATLEGWSSALELRERETAGHSQRVVQLTLNIARGLGVPDTDLRHIRMGALLHDIGKMGIPDSILLKPGPLTEDEWITMRQHPIYAYNLLKGIPHLQQALEIPHFHHEHWDGCGYPGQLKGEDIPLAARIFAVVDVWDALTSDHPYRPAWTHANALDYIRDQSGKYFDPEVVQMFIRMYADIFTGDDSSGSLLIATAA